MFFLPQTFVHFDMYVAIQHFILVWAGSLTLNAVHAFPPKYCDMLHSSARHLGYWDRVGVNSAASVQYAQYVASELGSKNRVQCLFALLIFNRWCPRTVWKQGSLVCSENLVYRARSDLNSAEPGSVHHKRFYVSN